MTHAPRRRRISAICAQATAGVDVKRTSTDRDADVGANRKPIAGTYLFAAVYGFERVERDRLFLAAHRQRTERATRHAGGKRADALNQRR